MGKIGNYKFRKLVSSQKTKHITLNLPLHALARDANAMTQKGNVVLYLDKELVEKSKALGFNLGKKRKRKS